MTDKTAMLPESFLFLLEQEEKRRQLREDAGLPALTILIDAAHSGGGQARHIRRFLPSSMHGESRLIVPVIRFNRSVPGDPGV